MEIINQKQKSRCELGVCKNRAEFAIRAKRLGARNEIHICKDCLSALNKQSSKILKNKANNEKTIKKAQDEKTTG
ncbi:MAG TPA: hypothetical protein GX745_00635 [Clostridiales bacterium]|nr:hypothetical protein [Clostridiales bacterium]